ncbi:hypothetical protein IAG44_00830 [Streptomyces roseirectus]|uniref:HTH cro/C1-type domain-containing protein n=1 Tax=Streptomyces roseirectus TaxID=2768066 RepID=A0A7H0I5T7_9ACTN|nr:hypothetical protein [Streptomyces roseirectus]QNP68153.1 hypothetical protein IAG44_00830 [Streptomyces roseirectus]
MGRRERPLDPADGPAARFAHELRKLRRDAGGLTYRAMAAKAHYSTATLAQAAAGDRLPSLAVALAYAGACGGDRAEWERRWHEAAREAAEEARAADEDTEPPYLGLARFGVDDADRFFGRDQLTGRLLDLVRRRHLVVVAGPSGSGKSSLLRAGLIARLQQTGLQQADPQQTGPAWTGPAAIRILTPGEHPDRTHAATLDPHTAPRGTLIVVDQLEEVFTLCADATERLRFLDRLCTAARPEHGLRVVVAVRGDFYGHLARHRPLAEAAQDATLLVAAMSQDELREAVVRPAALGGLVVERALTARITDEVTDEPGGLALMSHALLETWHRRRGRVLTEAAYDGAGGLRGAVARTAEDFHGRLTPGQAETARRILLRLVTPGQGSQDTRRPAERAEVTALGPGPAADADLVLERLARARLVTLDRDTVDLAHEAVLTSWPRLRAWIDEDRDRLRVQRHLTEAARTWQALGHDPGSLYRGLRLTLAEQHCAASGGRDDLTPLERRFLTAGLAARDRERVHRRARTLALTLLLVLSLLAGLVAWQQNQAGERRRTEAEARRVAGVADSLRTSDPRTAMRLSVAAWRIADLPETRSALLGAMAQPEQDAFTDPDSSTGTMRHLSADGRTLVSVGEREVARWDVGERRKVAVMPGLGARRESVAAMRADGGWLPFFVDPYGQMAGKVALVDLSTGRQDGDALGPADEGVEMGTSGRSLIAYDHTRSEHRVRLWDTERRRVLLDIGTPRRASAAGRELTIAQALRKGKERRTYPDSAGYPDATVTTDDRLLALCVPGQPLQLWDIAERRRLPTPWAPRPSRYQCQNERVHFTPDGHRLALVTEDDVRVWDIRSGGEAVVFEGEAVQTIAFSEDGRFLAAAGVDEIQLWRTDTPDAPVFRYELPAEAVSDLRVDPGEGWIRYIGGPLGDWGSAVRTLGLRDVFTDDWRPDTQKALFGPDGRTLATAQVMERTGHVRFRVGDVELPAVPCRKVSANHPNHCEVLMAFSSDGRTLAYGVSENPLSLKPPPRVSLWDMSCRRVTASPRLVKDDPYDQDLIVSLVFGPRDASLITSQVPMYGATDVWDPARSTLVKTMPHVNGDLALRPNGRLLVTSSGQAVALPSGVRPPEAQSPGQTSALAFSPDGHYLAAGDASGRTMLWDGGLTRRLGVLAGVADRYVSALAFSPDGRMLAVGFEDGFIRLWDTASRQRIGLPLLTPGDTVRALAFSPDGTELRVAGARTPPRAYGLAPDRAARDVCRRVADGLSAAEWRRHLPGIPYRRTCPDRG